MRGMMTDDPCALRGTKLRGRPLRTACANLRGVIDAGLHIYFGGYLVETERLLADNDQRGFHNHLKGMVGMDGRNTAIEQSIMDEDDTLHTAGQGGYS